MNNPFQSAARCVTMTPRSEDLLKLVTVWNSQKKRPITFYETLETTRLPSGPLMQGLLDLTKLNLIQLDGACDRRLLNFLFGPKKTTEQLLHSYFHESVVMCGGSTKTEPSDFVLKNLHERFTPLGKETLSPTPTVPTMAFPISCGWRCFFVCKNMPLFV